MAYKMMALSMALLVAVPSVVGSGREKVTVELDDEFCHVVADGLTSQVSNVTEYPNGTRPLKSILCEEPSFGCLGEDDLCIGFVGPLLKSTIDDVGWMLENPPEVDPGGPLELDRIENMGVGVAASASCDIDFLGVGMPLVASCLTPGFHLTGLATSQGGWMTSMSSTTDSDCVSLQPTSSSLEKGYSWQNNRAGVDTDPNSPLQDWCKWDVPGGQAIDRNQLKALDIHYCGNAEDEPQGRYACSGSTGMIHHYTVVSFRDTDVGYNTNYKYEFWGLFENGRKHPCTVAREESCWGYIQRSVRDGPFVGTTTSINAVFAHPNGLHGDLPGKGGFGGGLWWTSTGGGP